MTTAGEARIMAAIGEVKGEVRSLRGAVQETREEAAGMRAEVKAEVKGLRRHIEAVEERTDENRRDLADQGQKLAAVEATGRHSALPPGAAVKIIAQHPSEPPQVKVAKWKAWAALFGLGIPALAGVVLAGIQLLALLGHW